MNYCTAAYCSAKRLASYAYQLQEVLNRDPSHVLEIGIGPGIVSDVLRKAGVQLTTLDIDPAVHPDIVASVVQIPLASHLVDLTLCCEVLEHLPYDLFKPALSELRRVTRRYVVISLPDRNRFYHIEFVLPHVGHKRLHLTWPKQWLSSEQCDPEHYWELGNRDYPLGRIINDIQASGLSILAHYRIWEHLYHHMFVLEVH